MNASQTHSRPTLVLEARLYPIFKKIQKRSNAFAEGNDKEKMTERQRLKRDSISDGLWWRLSVCQRVTSTSLSLSAPASLLWSGAEFPKPTHVLHLHCPIFISWAQLLSSIARDCRGFPCNWGICINGNRFAGKIEINFTCEVKKKKKKENEIKEGKSMS